MGVYSSPAGDLTRPLSCLVLELDREVSTDYGTAQKTLLRRTKEDPKYRHLLHFLPTGTPEGHDARAYNGDTLRAVLDFLRGLSKLDNPRPSDLEGYKTKVMQKAMAMGRAISSKFDRG